MGPRSPHASGHAAVGVCRVDVFRAITSTCWSRWQIVCGRYNDLMVLWWSIKMEWRRWKLLISFAHRFYLPNGLGGVGKIMFFIIGDFSPAIDWRPVQGVPCLRPKSAGIGSSPPRPCRGLSGVHIMCTDDGWMDYWWFCEWKFTAKVAVAYITQVCCI